jgi:hypothetical protein
VLAAHRGAAAPPTKKQVSDTVAGLRYTTERLARDALAEIQNGMVSGTFVSRSTRTVEQACAEWLAGRHSIRPTIRAGYEHALSPLRHRHGARTTFAPGLRPAPCPDAAPRTQSSSASITKSPTECSRTCRGSIRMSTNGSPTMRSEPSCVQCGFLTPMSWRRKAEQLARESISWIATTGVRLDEADLVLDLLCRWVFHRSAGWAVSYWSF